MSAGAPPPMSPAESLSGRRVVITGAARGLGRAFAIKAAEHGADLVLLARSAAALDPLAELIRRRTGRHVTCVPCDLADAQSVAEACRQTLAATPIVDVLINNGASWLPGRFEQLADADITATVATTVTGTMLITRGLLPALRRSVAADVVTIVSTAGLPGERSGAVSVAFRAAKQGQSGFSEALRDELRGTGIRVTAIYPPDFDDTDPLKPEWDEPRAPVVGAKLTNREVVATILFAVCAPRICGYPAIVLDNPCSE